jgi:arginine exporter protein ArgO
VAGGAALDGVLQPAADWLQALSVLALVLLAALTVATGVRSYRRRSSVAATSGPDLLDSDADPDERAVSRVRTTLRPVRAYFALLGLTALNPATLAYFTALVLGTQADAAVSTPDRVVFVAAVFVASAAWQLLLVVTGAALGHVAGGRRGQLAIALVSGAVMLALAARLAS